MATAVDPVAAANAINSLLLNIIVSFPIDSSLRTFVVFGDRVAVMPSTALECRSCWKIGYQAVVDAWGNGHVAELRCNRD